MRIYMAAFYQTRKAQAFIGGTAYARAAMIADPEYNLESFHYVQDMPIIGKMLRHDKHTVFLDSGAFSMFTQNVKVDLKAYAKFVQENQDIIHLASNLDAIGAGQEQLTYERQKQLEAMGADVKPVFHARDRDVWLQRYLDEGYEYVFLGGMVPESAPYLLEWLDHVWHSYLTNPDGTPRVKVHGFGLTSTSLMFRYPWFSVDSTSWVMKAMFGRIYFDLPKPDGSTKLLELEFSTKSSSLKNINSWHYVHLNKRQKDIVHERLEQLEAGRKKYPEIEAEMERQLGFKQGYNVRSLSESYGWRDHFNINYFKRAQSNAVKTFKRQQETLFT